jgi:hypothetical protein
MNFMVTVLDVGFLAKIMKGEDRWCMVSF